MMFTDISTTALNSVGSVTEQAAYSSTFGYVMNVFLFVFFLIVVYFTTKFIGKSAKIRMSGNNVKIIEKLPISADKYFLLMFFEGYYYILYIDKNGAVLIDKRDDIEKLQYSYDGEMKSKGFKDVLGDLVSRKEDKGWEDEEN